MMVSQVIKAELELLKELGQLVEDEVISIEEFNRNVSVLELSVLADHGPRAAMVFGRVLQSGRKYLKEMIGVREALRLSFIAYGKGIIARDELALDCIGVINSAGNFHPYLGRWARAKCIAHYLGMEDDRNYWRSL